MGDKAVEVVLSPETARRMLETIKWVEAQRGVTESGRSDIRPMSANYYALVTSSIGAGNLTGSSPTLGKGKVTLYYIKDAGGTSAPLVPVPGQTNITIFNGGASIAAGRFIQVKYVSGGLSCDVDYC